MLQRQGNVTLTTGIGTNTTSKTVLIDYEKYGQFHNLSIKGTIDQIDKQIIRIAKQFMSIQAEITLCYLALTGNLIPNTKSNALIDAKTLILKFIESIMLMIYLKVIM